MKKGGGHSKGADFERQICKTLSLWWTADADECRDDLFWRTAGSGARATMRSKLNKSTINGYGDIMACTAEGTVLLSSCCFELKRGYNPDLMAWFKGTKNNLIQAWDQCVRSADEARARFPVLIFKPDRQPIFMMSVKELFIPFARDLQGLTRVRIDPVGCAVYLFLEFLSTVSALQFRNELCMKPKRLEV